MLKKFKRRLIILLFFIVIGLGGYYYAFMYAPNTVQIRTETISSRKIPTSINPLKIGVISDVNGDINLLRDALVSSKNHEVDALFILGNLFVETPTPEETETYTNLFKEYQPPLGTYATYSIQDYSVNVDTLNQIYKDADVYSLTNKALEFHNLGNDYINIVGLESSTDSKESIELYFPEVNHDIFTLTFVHDYTMSDVIPESYSDVIVSGNTLGGKVSIPFIGSIDSKYPAVNPRYQQGQQIQINHQGLGVGEDKVRFNTQAELIILEITPSNEN